MIRLAHLDDGYRHVAKQAAAGDPLLLGQAHLKWYDLAIAGDPVPAAIGADARRYLGVQGGDALGLVDDRGFVILHRCGASFFFLLASVWRGSNELWESVYYRDATMNGFARFDPAYPARGPRPTFCVWELGIVAFEAAAWSRFLASPREREDMLAWQDSHFSGAV